jgi:nitrous oxide reductase
MRNIGGWMMARNAYIKLVPSSVKKDITLDEVKDLLLYYKNLTSKTGDQLDWNYEHEAFPYEIKEKEEANGKWFYLLSDHDRYHAIIIGVDQETIVHDDGTEIEQSYIQITLPESSTFGDKGKANEFCKFLAKKLQGELHLFNGRIMYYYPRKL